MIPDDSLVLIHVYYKLWPSTYKYLTVSVVAPQLCLCLSLAQSTLSSLLFICLVWAHTLLFEPLNH
jgi:hypothetical protein